jgi:PhoPQ-activated pathogenicity-related protein
MRAGTLAGALLTWLAVAWTCQGDETCENDTCEAADDNSLLQLGSKVSEKHKVRSTAEPFIDVTFDFAPSPADIKMKGCEGFSCMETYVNDIDETYSWKDMGIDGKGKDRSNGIAYEYKILEMFSGTWRSEADVDRPVWHHFMFVVTPANLGNFSTSSNKDIAFISVGNADALKDFEAITESLEAKAALQYATRTGMISVALYGVPYKGTRFVFDRSPIYRVFEESNEEWQKATSWYLYALNQDSPEWPIEMPMMRAVVRAMDTVQELTKNSSTPIQRFALTGCSKRSIAILSATAVDKRVIYTLPCSLPINFRAAKDGQALGEEVWAMNPYTQTQKQIVADVARYHKVAKGKAIANSEERLLSIIDPITWIEKTKHAELFFLQTSNDDFSSPDNARQFWDLLPGEKHYSLVPNKQHLGTSSLDDYIPIGSTFLKGKLMGKDVPRIDWKIDYSNVLSNESEATITADGKGDHKPKAVTMWVAETCDDRRRDFRYFNEDQGMTCLKCGLTLPVESLDDQERFTDHMPTCYNKKVSFSPRNVSYSPDSTTWKASLRAPKGKWAAFYMQLEYEWPQKGDHYVISTGAAVVPDTYPFGPNLQQCEQTAILRITCKSLGIGAFSHGVPAAAAAAMAALPQSNVAISSPAIKLSSNPLPG